MGTTGSVDANVSNLTEDVSQLNEITITNEQKEQFHDNENTLDDQRIPVGLPGTGQTGGIKQPVNQLPDIKTVNSLQSQKQLQQYYEYMRSHSDKS